MEHTIFIDGKTITVKRDTLLIEAAKELGIFIPTLCYNENIHPYGVCRVCMVELKDGKRTRFVPSCVYEIRKDGLEVTTHSEKVLRNRKWILNLLLARCPNVLVIQDLAAQYGITEPHPRLKKMYDDCILCGLCVRTCHEIVGVAAIAFEGRGEKREVTTPWRVENSACIACGSCVYVCPTDCIHLREEKGVRTISRWEGEKAMVVRETSMLVCESCGNYFLPEGLIQVFAKKMGLDTSIFKICNDCR